MRKSVMAAAVVILTAGATAGGLVANAQNAPPPGTSQETSAPPEHRPGWMRHEHHRWHEREGRGPVNPGTFALVYRQADRKLTPSDVQKIAEAFLLWNGNHDWKIVQVAPASGDQIGFAVATADNGPVIARFTMNAHTGRVTRTE